MTAEELAALWRDLGEEDARASGLVRRRVLPDAPIGLFACVVWPASHIGFQIEVEGDQRIARDRLPVCKGLKIGNDSFRGARPHQSITIQLENAALREVFAVLASDLMGTGACEVSARAGLDRCLDRLSMWQGLLEQLPDTGLGLPAQRGLLGELLVLQGLHLAVLDPLAAVTSWNGPGRAYQDFTTGGVGVEVKTSLGKRHAHLRVTSERQLDETPFDDLFLAHVGLVESASGLSLADQVAAVRERLGQAHAALSEFNLRLLAAGYLDSHEESYRESAYLTERMDFYRVDGDFPRLTGALLPPGVGDVTYTIIADDLARFGAEFERVATAVGAAHG